MQRKKIYNVSLYFDLHAVTCPGVWLCPKGKVAVRVGIFGVSEITKLIPPVFPLNFHERFHFQKKYKKASSLHQVESIVHRVPVWLELLQCPEGLSTAVTLAEFRASVGDIIYPPGGDVDLLFYPKNTFPGIIAPKAEVSTKIALTNGSGVKDNNVVPTTVFSKGTKSRKGEEPIIRQKPVCHTKHYLYCSCFDKNAQRIFSKALEKRKEILGKSKTSEEVYRKVSPAHKLSHRNQGDYIQEHYEDKFDNGVDDCRCEYQCGFEGKFDQYHGGTFEENPETVARGNDRPPLQTGAPDQYIQRRSVDKTQTVLPEQNKVKEMKFEGKHGSCCYCCPRAQQNPSHNPWDLLTRKVPTVSSVLSEVSDTEVTKKHSLKPSCTCPHCVRLKGLLRKLSVDSKVGNEEQLVFCNNLRKAYQNLLREYYGLPDSGVNHGSSSH